LEKNKIYFASDFHLGSPSLKESHIREKIIVKWLDMIKIDAHSVYLLGDIFDFWFEYKKVVPKGFIRFLGKLSELSDLGIEVHFFVGNHDLWAKNYLNKEIGINIHHKNKIIKLQNKNIFLSHGDGLGKGNFYFKCLKLIFKSSICNWLFSLLHPDFAIKIAHYWSNMSRKNNNEFSYEKDVLFQYAKERKNKIDYFIFGHTHNPILQKIDKNCIYVNLGEWIKGRHYAVLEKGNISLKQYSIKD